MKQLIAIALSLLMFMSVITAGVGVSALVVSAAGNTAVEDPFEYSDLVVEPNDVAVNDPVSVSSTVRNTGTETDTYTGPLKIDGERVENADETIGPGNETTVTFEWSFANAGSYEVTIGGLPAETVNVTDASTGPVFEYSAMGVSSSTAVVGESVDVSVDITNTGDEAGEYTAELLENGTNVDTKTGLLASGVTETVTFSWSTDQPGSYELSLGGMSELVTVNDTPAEPVSYEIDTSQTTVSATGVWEVTEDISNHRIVVNSGDVLIEGNGYLIDGITGDQEPKNTEYYGIHVELESGETISNVTVRNLTIARWGHGIHFENGDDLTVEDVTFEENRVGLYADSVTALVVTGSTFDSSVQHGVRLKVSDDATFTENTFVDQGHRGMFSSGSGSVTIAGNTFTGDEIGVRLHYADQSVVENNQFDVEDIGIDVTASENSSVIGNDITAKGTGIRVGKVGQDADDNSNQGSSGSSDDHTHDDGGSDDHTHDDDSDDHTHEDDSDDHTHDDGSESGSDDDHGADESGPIQVKDNVINSADKGILLDDVQNVEMANNTYRNIKSWMVYGTDGAVVSELTQETLKGTKIVYTGRDIALNAVDSAPEDPSGYTNIGKFVSVSMTSDDAWIDMAFPYVEGDLHETNADDLRIWRYDGNSWELADTPTWLNNGNSWDAVHSNEVDTGSRMVSANVSAMDMFEDERNSGYYGPLVGPTENLVVAPRVDNASLNPTTVHQGESAGVSADVSNDASTRSKVSIDLLVDGNWEDSDYALLQPESSQPVSFDLTVDEVGTQAVEIGGVSAGTLTVLEATEPVADAGEDRTTKVGESLEFSGSGSSDNVGIVDYAWDFDDGTNASGMTVTHAFDSAGTYNVTLTVRDGASNEDSDTVAVTVTKKDKKSKNQGSNVINDGDDESAGDTGSTAAAGSQVQSGLQSAPTQSGAAEAFVRATAGHPMTIDFSWMAPESDSGLQMESMVVTTNRDMEYYLQAATGVIGQSDKPAFDGKLGEPMDYIEFTHSFQDESVDNAVITFVLGTDKIENPELVRLYRHHQGAWQPIDLQLIGQTGSEYVFEANSPGLSVFALAYDREPTFGIATHGLDKDRYLENEPFEIGATIHNPYRAAMNVDMPLGLNGTVVDSRTVTISPGETADVRFELAIERAGVYAISVGNTPVGTVSVGMPDKPTPTTPEPTPEPASAVEVGDDDSPDRVDDTEVQESGLDIVSIVIALMLAILALLVLGYRIRR